MQKKIVIGIDLDAALKKTIIKALKMWKDFPVKWHKEDSLHIQLLSLGWIGENDLLDVRDIVADVAGDTTGFSVHFDSIRAAAKDPSQEEMSKAQIVRLVGQESDALKDLYIQLTSALDIPASNKNAFRPVVEIGRMRAKKWEALDVYPANEIPFSCDMDVVSLTIFEIFVDEGKRSLVPVDVFELA